LYNKNADKLAQQYLSKKLAQVDHCGCLFLPSVIKNSYARMLAIGAGAAIANSNSSII
jgi:hypothetical protein